MGHTPQTMVMHMLELRSQGRTPREISEQSGYSKKQVDKFFERQNRKVRMAQAGNIPKHKGRPRSRPITTSEEMALRIKELEREVELLRSFLHAAGRM